MSIQYTDFSVAQGATFNALVRVASGSGGPIDLSSASLSGMLRTDYGTLNPAITISFTMIDAPSGTFYMTIPAATTAQLIQRKYYYDVLATEGAGAYRLLEGSIFIRPSVTR